MHPMLQGMKVAVLGGDERELELIRELVQEGAVIKALCLPPGFAPAAAALFPDPGECVADADAVILPVPGIDEKGRLHCTYTAEPLLLTWETVARIPRKAPVFVGMARQNLVDMASKRGLRLVQLMQMDEVAILNSIPSAEGAIQMAMEMMPATIHGSNAFVLGFGRTGMTLARALHALGAVTRVVARNPSQLARAYEMGLLPLTFDELPRHLTGAGVIFNTVPAPVLTRELLSLVSPETVIIDLASSPGGTDFPAAAEMGVKAVLAPGLPGKVAPKTAGRILARVIKRLLVEGKAGR
ncbi:MAG: dipicolinate synthase subunit DpsA [Firmicutes bacterium]|nr:dipicolinate synthase subunit DpsA [Bacillota bacterium]